MIDTNRNIQYKNKVNLNYKQKPLWGVVVGGDNLYIYILILKDTAAPTYSRAGKRKIKLKL